MIKNIFIFIIFAGIIYQYNIEQFVLILCLEQSRHFKKKVDNHVLIKHYAEAMLYLWKTWTSWRGWIQSSNTRAIDSSNSLQRVSCRDQESVAIGLCAAQVSKAFLSKTSTQMKAVISHIFPQISAEGLQLAEAYL